MKIKDSKFSDIMSVFGIEQTDAYEKKIEMATSKPDFSEFTHRLVSDDRTKELEIEYHERYKLVEIEIIPFQNVDSDIVYEKKETIKIFKDKESAWNYFISKQSTNLGDDMSHVYWNDDAIELWFGDFYGFQLVYILYKWDNFDKDIELDEDCKKEEAYSNFVKKTRWDKVMVVNDKIKIRDEDLPF